MKKVENILYNLMVLLMIGFIFYVMRPYEWEKHNMNTVSYNYYLMDSSDTKQVVDIISFKGNIYYYIDSCGHIIVKKNMVTIN